jgi:nickel-type superoxide dismutase maturation protease
MQPALSPGDYAIVDRGAYRATPPRPGQIVLARDPRDRSRALVKRVGWIDSDGRIWLLGDRTDQSTDSLTFGPVAPDLIIGRVRWRYWRSTGPIQLSWRWVSLSPEIP